MYRPIRLQDGRELWFEEYGDPSGAPVMLFHGMPASSRLFAFCEEPARELGVRAIAPDRPGIRRSTFLRGRRAIDWPADVAALADSLGLERFGVLAWSGGSPYALACAARLPDRIASCVIAAGVAPHDRSGLLDTYPPSERRMILLARRRPRVADAVLRAVRFLAERFPERALASFERDLAPVDVEILRRGERSLDWYLASFERGPRGVRHDYAVEGSPWGFATEEIQIPVELVHGDADATVTVAHGRWLADHIPRARLETLEGAGHLFPLERAAELLRAGRP